MDEEKVYCSMYSRNAELYHHGIKGQKWGVRNGPPYPLDSSAHSKSEKMQMNKTKKSNSLGPNNATRQAIIKKKLRDKEKEFDKIDKRIDELDKRDEELNREVNSIIDWDNRQNDGFYKIKDEKRYNEITNELEKIDLELNDRFSKYHTLQFEIDQLKKGRDISVKQAADVRKAYSEIEGFTEGEKKYKEMMSHLGGSKAGLELAKIRDKMNSDIASDPKIKKLAEEAHKPGAFGSEKWFEWRDAIWDKRIEYNEEFTDTFIKNSKKLKDYKDNKDIRDFINEDAQWQNDARDYYAIWDPDIGERSYDLEDYLHNWKRRDRTDIDTF